MTEWEKLKQGLTYNDFDKDLFDRRVRAKKLFKAYNKTDDSEIEQRQQLLRELCNKIGDNVWIEPDFRCEFGKNISIGNNVYINFGCIILDCAEVTIGNNTLLGPNIGIYAVNHAIDAEERMNGGCFGKPVHIGNRVWLGGDVKIMAGITIGDGSIIGAGSIVTKDVPSGVIAAGNPCRVIRKISEEMTAEKNMPTKEEIGEFRIRSFDALTTRELYEIFRARADVFTGEEKILYPDADGVDYESIHVFAQNSDGRVRAYLRMFPKTNEPGTVQMGRVLTRVHRTGLGKKLLDAGIQAAAQYMNAKEIYVESQKHAEGFYLKSGFITTSETFMEAGIPHVQMRLKIGSSYKKG